MKHYVMTVHLSVADSWIDDGFDMTNQKTQQNLEYEAEGILLPYADAGTEVKFKVAGVKEVKKLPVVKADF